MPDDDGNGLADTISLKDKNELKALIDETLGWIEENPEAEKKHYDEKQNWIKNISNPIIRQMYANSEDDGYIDDFGDDDL